MYHYTYDENPLEVFETTTSINDVLDVCKIEMVYDPSKQYLFIKNVNNDGKIISQKRHKLLQFDGGGL
jgi:hypothetical protein